MGVVAGEEVAVGDRMAAAEAAIRTAAWVGQGASITTKTI